MHVTVVLRSAHPAQLDRLATRVASPGSTQFRHFLHPAQVQRRPGPPAAALARARAWLRGQHLVTQPVLADGLLLPVTGSVRQFEAAFRVKIARIRLAGGRLAWANQSAPELPGELRRWVAAIVGLDSLHVPHPELARGALPSQVPQLTAQPELASGVGSVPGPQACPAARATRHVYTAAWLATAYRFNPLYRAGDFGQHVTVALYELADYANQDIQTHDQCYQINPAIQRVRVDGGTSIAANPGGTVEATSDIEVVQAMAPPCHAPRGQDCREVPDVSALAALGTGASPGERSTRGYVVYGTAGKFGGRGWQTVGGTSLATPLWAALTALADQQRGSHRLGLLSPSLYRIDRTNPQAFTDVRTGNNDYLSRQGRYSHHTCRYGGQRGKPCYHATRGYDMASGLGTPQASYLVAALLREHSNAGLG